ncbi:MAG: thiol reductant ABC exporter subunit CydD, partial [Nocardioidaceae bacterium]
MRPLDPSIVRHLRPATPSMAGLVAASVAASGLLIAQAFALTHLLVALARGATAELPLAAAMVAGVVVARAVVGYLGDLCAAHASATVSRHLRRRLVHAMLGLSARESSSRRTGELSLLATRGVAATEPYLTRYLPALLLAVVLPPLTVVAIATQDLLAALIVLLTLPLVPLFAVLVGMATRDRADRQWAALSGLAGHFVDVVKGLPTLVAHGRADAQSTTIRRVTDRHRVATLSTLRLAFASSAVLELVATLSVALVAVVVGLRLATGSLDLATALVVLLLAPEAYWPLRRVGAEFHAAAEGTAAFAAAEEIVAGVPTPVAAATGPDRTAPWPGVSVSGLTVRYPGRTAPALDLAEDLDLPARGLVAVVGPSGSGKSTLLAALAGELVPDRGRIGSGDLLLDADSVDRWREQVAWLPQRPWLTSGSVRDNLTLARAGVGDTELWAALSRVGLREVVAGLPGGLSATVGEDGERLSAGQRARLALARAVVAGRPLVLVDEPSAHLDRDSEQVVVETLVWLAHRSTVVVVTHSPAVMTSASRVVRLAEPVLPEPAPAGPVPAEPVLRAQSRARVPAVAEPSPQGGSGRGRWALSVALGVLAAASGVALTVTSGWLIARASQHPPILFLTVAIVGVRAFGIAR